MKKISIICVCIIALVVFAVWAPNADAVDGINCTGCHGQKDYPSRYTKQEVAEIHSLNSYTSCIGCHSTSNWDNVDADRDNFTENEGDCDDRISAVSPVAAEDCNDGIDNDCNGLSDMEDPDCAPDPVCGDGVLDPDEACDTIGQSATCEADCKVPACGDRILNIAAGEECDDGNNTDADGCQADCMLPTAAAAGAVLSP